MVKFSSPKKCSMKSLDMSFQQIWPTDCIVTSRNKAGIPISPFSRIVDSRVSERIFEQLEAPSTTKDQTRVCVSILSNMVTNGRD
jgi:hypothetical protein